MGRLPVRGGATLKRKAHRDALRPSRPRDRPTPDRVARRRSPPDGPDLSRTPRDRLDGVGTSEPSAVDAATDGAAATPQCWCVMAPTALPGGPGAWTCPGPRPVEARPLHAVPRRSARGRRPELPRVAPGGVLTRVSRAASRARHTPATPTPTPPEAAARSRGAADKPGSVVGTAPGGKGVGAAAGALAGRAGLAETPLRRRTLRNRTSSAPTEDSQRDRASAPSVERTT